jgi:pyruvate,water dikinase
MKAYIVPLEGGRQASKPEVGGKGSSLLWLAQQEFKTAPGFIVATEAFIDGQLGGVDAQPKIEEAIRDAYRQLGGRVAVRSSMVAEDGVDASFAGQLDTHLNIEGADAVMQTVRACWSSMANPRVSEYLKQHNGDFDIAMAVVVQKMVEARAAGVAFSADPISGEDVVIIEATRGLGDVVAGGLVNPGRWVVSSEGKILDTQNNSPEDPALTDEQACEFAQIVRRVGVNAGSPQDVEWAWDGRDFILLQARPITTLHDRDTYSSRFVSEMVPGLVKPLVWSTTTSAIAENVFAHVFDELLGKGNVDASKLVRRIHSRVYANVTLLGKACEKLGLPANFFETITRGERPTNVRQSFLSLTNLPEKFRLMRFVWRNSRAARNIEAFVTHRHAELEPFRRLDASALGIEELLSTLEQLKTYHSDAQWYVFITALNMSVRNRLLGRMVRSAAPDVSPGDLLSGSAPSQALGANRALLDMASLARGMDESSKQDIISGDIGAIHAALNKTNPGKALLETMDRFIAQFGFLSANGTDFSLPSWRETPAMLWQMVGRLAGQEQPSFTDAAERQRVALATVRSHLRPVRRMRFNRLLTATLKYLDLRERVSQLISEDAHLMRRVYLALAEKLTAQGKLAQCDDIFFLAHNDVEGLARGTMSAEEAKRLVAARQFELAKDAGFDPPEVMRGGVSARRRGNVEEEKSSDVLTGISGSAGVVEGRARIVRDPSLAPRDLSRSDILIVPFTDVGWTPLLAGIGGIVAETGGQLSHTAIVAREYGLPAVVSVKRATQRVREGQLLLVDGGEGRVYLQP